MMAIFDEVSIMARIKGTKGAVFCPDCGKSQFRLPQDESSDSIIRCECGTELGPIFSLRALANEEPHTGVYAVVKG
jgi:hypothetical protein